MMIDQEGIKIVSRTVDETARVKLIEVGGFVDQANCHLLQNIIDQCLNDQYYNLVFDLQSLVYMSSAGWGVLIGEIRRFRESAGDIKLANMGPEIYEVYQMLEFYHIISEYGTLEEAFKSFDMMATSEKFDIRRVQKKTEKELPEAPEAAEETQLPESESPAEEETIEEAEKDDITEDVEKDEAEEISPAIEEPIIEEPEESTVIEDVTTLNEPSEVETFTSDAVDIDLEETSLPEEPQEVELPIEQENDEEITSDDSSEIDETELTEVPGLDETPDIYSEQQEEANTEKIDTSSSKTEEQTEQFTEERESESFSEKQGAEAYAEEEPVENKGIILEEEIDVNIDGILANEGISKSISQIDPSGYIAFDPEKYNRNINIKVMPIPDKIRDIVSKYPELSPRQIQKMLTHPDYGGVKIGFFKLRSLLKALDLETKEKRYRFYRSA